MRNTLNNAYKDAMKAQDKLRTSTIRLINAAIKDKDIEARGQGKEQTDDAGIVAILQKMVKQRHESAEIYAKAGRIELANQENDELRVLESFMPVQMSEKEVYDAVADAVAKTAAKEMKDMGKVMAELKSKFAGKMDFSKANAVIKARLS